MVESLFWIGCQMIIPGCTSQDTSDPNKPSNVTLHQALRRFSLWGEQDMQLAATEYLIDCLQDLEC